MKIILNLKKMRVEPANPVKYYLDNQNESYHLNDFLGREIKVSYQHQINCIRCGEITKTSFAQGYCYSCFITSPETEDCVLRPELCQAHLGKARDLVYAENHCLIDHYVYMALSGGLKVGVTRYTQKPVRWIDQGAAKAIIIAKTPNRFLAGSIEVALKKHFQDKTNWRKMLGSENQDDTNLVSQKQIALELLHQDFRQFKYEDNTVNEFTYPVLQYPSKIRSVGLDKQTQIKEVLTGIKGQYFIFRSGEVINIRKHGGYLVEISG